MGIEKLERELQELFGTKEPTNFNKKLNEYSAIFGDYPPSEPDYPFEEDEMIEIMDYCIQNGVKFEDAVGFEYEEGYVY